MIWYEVLLRLVLAIIVGWLIGYEREYKNRPAWLEMHILSHRCFHSSCFIKAG